MIAKIVSIAVKKMYETCERTTYSVDVTTDEGFEMTVAGHATGSVYTNGEGLSIEEARERALCDAADWGDFLGIQPDDFIEDGVVKKPTFEMRRYETRRALRRRDESMMYCTNCGEDCEALQFQSVVGRKWGDGWLHVPEDCDQRSMDYLCNPNNLSSCCDSTVTYEELETNRHSAPDAKT